MFKRYRSLPKEIKAARFTEQNKDRIFNELTGQYATDFEGGRSVLKVTTVHGEIAIVRLGDWIAEDAILGTYYPIKSDIFKDTYEEVEE